MQFRYISYLSKDHGSWIPIILQQREVTTINSWNPGFNVVQNTGHRLPSNIFSIFVTMYHEILCLYLYFQNMGKNPATLQMCMCVRVGEERCGGCRHCQLPRFPLLSWFHCKEMPINCSYNNILTIRENHLMSTSHFSAAWKFWGRNQQN